MTPEENREYHRNWANINRKQRKRLNDKWRVKQQNNFSEFKSTLKCSHCPENDAVCLEFHHLDPTKKETAIGTVANKWSLKRLKAEIEKCIVLCANCHRKEHARLKL